jgi:predicted HicB family RNase H-like nuclease
MSQNQTEPHDVGPDGRVSVDIDIDDDVILQLALEAHKRDITLNKMVEIILQEVIDRHKVNGTLD